MILPNVRASFGPREMGFLVGALAGDSVRGRKRVAARMADEGLDRLLDDPRTLGAPLTGEHSGFWRWRDAWPGRPYWVHFQNTDVHWPWEPVPPVAGTYLSHERRLAFYEMERRIGEVSGTLGRSWALRAPPQVFA